MDHALSAIPSPRLTLGLVGSLLAMILAIATRAVAQPEFNAVQPRAVAQFDAIKPGETIIVAVVLDHSKGYHTWPEASVKLPDAVNESATRTAITTDALPKWVDRLDPIQWPPAKPGQVADPTGEHETVTVPLYSDRAVVFVPVVVAKSAPAGEQSITLKLAYQSCNDKVCEMPQDRELIVRVRVLAVGAADQPKANEAALFVAYDPGATLPSPPPPQPAATPAKPSSSTPVASAPPPSLFGFSLGSGLLVIFLLAAVGGFVLNLTPCVLPVIPIKVLTLTQHAGGDRKRALGLGLWMALGVVAFWVAAGLPMVIFSKTAGDPSRLIFGTWWITFSLGLIIAAMGLGIMGLFTLNLPQSVYMINPKADTPWGSFVFGVMTAVLGLPCFGFVAGGLLAGAATLPPLTIMTVFFGLGVGMAAPYLILSANPGLLNFVPRTGPASDLVKQVMGLLLIAAAAFFVSAGLQGLMADKPYLAESISWWAVAFFTTVAALWLAVRTIQISKAAWPKVAMPLFGLIAAGLCIAFASGETATAKESYLRSQEAAAGESGTLVTGAWSDYSNARMDKAKAAGGVILVDFTAKWCINCRAFKKFYLDTDPVKSRLRDLNAVMFHTDLTSESAPGWKFLNQLGQTNVPTIAIYGPAVKEPIIFNAYTSETVMKALDAVTGKKASASMP